MIDRATGGLAFWRRMTCLLIWLLQAYSGAGCSVPFFIYDIQRESRHNVIIFVIIFLKSSAGFPFLYYRKSLYLRVNQ